MRSTAMMRRRVVPITLKTDFIVLNINGIRKVRRTSEDNSLYKEYPIQNENGHEYYINDDKAKCFI